MTRVAIIGNAGGGKSTLGRRLSQTLGIGLFPIARIQWKPGWIPASLEEIKLRSSRHSRQVGDRHGGCDSAARARTARRPRWNSASLWSRRVSIDWRFPDHSQHWQKHSNSPDRIKNPSLTLRLLRCKLGTPEVFIQTFYNVLKCLASIWYQAKSSDCVSANPLASFRLAGEDKTQRDRLH